MAERNAERVYLSQLDNYVGALQKCLTTARLLQQQEGNIREAMENSPVEDSRSEMREEIVEIRLAKTQQKMKVAEEWMNGMQVDIERNRKLLRDMSGIRRSSVSRRKCYEISFSEE